MLISSNVLKPEQSAETLNPSVKGQGLPQEAKFSDLFASMYQPTEEKIESDSEDLPSINVFNISDSDSSSTEMMDDDHIMNLVENIVNSAQSKDVLNSDNNLTEESVDIDLSVDAIADGIIDEGIIDDTATESVDDMVGTFVGSQETVSVNGVQAQSLALKHTDNSQEDGLIDESSDFESTQEDPAMIAANAPLHVNNAHSVGLDSKASSVSLNGNSAPQSQNQAQTQTQFGNSANESQASASGSSQSNQSFSQNGSQQNQFAQQQAQMMQQTMKAQAVEQQLNVKATDELIVKADSKESLLGASFSSLEGRSQLPLGLQSITLPVKSPQWGQALGQRVVYIANNQLQKANITLNPEKLGPVQVKLHMDKDNQLHVTMHAQHATTREAMDNALPRLREMLEQAGVNLGSLDVGDDRQFSENAESESSYGRSNGHSEENEVQQLNESSTAKVVATDNIVDYYA
ncbi:flagellar hook-length control protein FliK [Thiomicrorhabdus sp. Milos-T2]|uniref:flagellar hook-length control protein FliK n=1 Tax=Thiomicrorhabdus sp. Milos-T2 TaxID=90814 RepID=UPI0004940587|nr:flagellar hook-length control protein FliK [Thiomicrorhabdus sp. Milos-T2]